MTILIDKKIGNDTSHLRLTIQIDLSGFSFKISNSLGEFLYSYKKPFPVGLLSISDINIYLKKELESHPLLIKNYAAVRVYFGTEKYCMVPLSFFRESEVEGMLSRLHNIEPTDHIISINLEDQRAVLIYVIPDVILSNTLKVQPNAEFYPISYYLLDRVSLTLDNNKVLVHFSENIVHIVVAEKEKLLIANSFPASDFTTAEYYIFLVMKEVCFNTESTTLYVSGIIKAEEEAKLKLYFKGVVKKEL